MPHLRRMKNILITGASGMIGGLVLRECLERPDIGRVTSLVRKSSGMAHPKLKEVVVRDFQDTAAYADELKDQHVCFYCIGVYTGALPPAEFRKVMTERPAAFATALKRSSPDTTFCLLSGDGADRTEKSRFMFARDRGAAERIISELGFPRFHAFRPGYIYPVEKRVEPNLSYRVFRILWKPLLSWMTPGMGLTSHQLAHALVKVGMGQEASEIVDNNGIKRIAKD
jgi:uncharacterized protein YbjT (DUF2867 family)